MSKGLRAACVAGLTLLCLVVWSWFGTTSSIPPQNRFEIAIMIGILSGVALGIIADAKMWKLIGALAAPPRPSRAR